MVFTTYEFIFIFLPAVYLIYRLLNRLGQPAFSKLWLAASSFWFFSKGSAWFLPWFAVSIAFNCFICRALLKKKSKLLLALGLLENIGLLGYYKYANFLIYSTNRFFSMEIPSLEIVLPLGISFFTFMMISFLLDCYNGGVKEFAFTDYLLYVTFFPKLISGPIVRYGDFAPQINAERAFDFNFENFQKGFFIFSIGCAKKALVANPLLGYTQSVFTDVSLAGPHEIFIGLFTNLFAFYFDFSGYVDMAVGVGYFFNIKLPENFDSPYRSRNIQQYWKKWHITLGLFLNRYVFSYLYKPGKGLISFCAATMVTFFISGLWHGAGWSYIFWGLLHGAAVCIVAVVAVHYPKKYLMNKRAAQIITFIFLLISASLYACPGIAAFFNMLKKLMSAGCWAESYAFDGGYSIMMFFYDNIYVLLVLLAAAFITFFAKTTKEYAKSCTDNKKYALFAGILFAVSVFNMRTESTFLYFAF